MFGSTTDSGEHLAVSTTLSRHTSLAREGKRLYLVSPSRPLRDVVQRAAHAAGCEVEVLGCFTELPPPPELDVGALVVEAAAVRTEERLRLLKELSSVYNTLLINEGFDNNVVDLLHGELCNHSIDIERLSLEHLIVTMNKLVTGDIFGVEKYLPWGVPIQTAQVFSYEQKRAAIELICRYLRHLGCRRPLVGHIEHAVEELLMNALYDAPIQEGESRDRVVQSLIGGARAEQPVTLRFASGGNIFLLSVTDAFGRLSKGTVVERLRGNVEDIGLHTGAGLFVLMSSAAQVIVNVAPGSCTEVISFFELRWPITRPGVHAFHYFEEPGHGD
jgi:hypothetical protein